MEHSSMLWQSISALEWCRQVSMMTSSNENIFHVTGHLWGESTCDRWLPLTKASDVELWCFLWSAPEQMIDQKLETPMIWDAIVFIMKVMKIFFHGKQGSIYPIIYLMDSTMAADDLVTCCQDIKMKQRASFTKSLSNQPLNCEDHPWSNKLYFLLGHSIEVNHGIFCCMQLRW